MQARQSPQRTGTWIQPALAAAALVLSGAIAWAGGAPSDPSDAKAVTAGQATVTAPSDPIPAATAAEIIVAPVKRVQPKPVVQTPPSKVTKAVTPAANVSLEAAKPPVAAPAKSKPKAVTQNESGAKKVSRD